MCTVLLLLRPDDAWPLIVAANRDERLDRAFAPPARHWPEASGIVAGRDLAGGGSWFGVNDDGVVATIVNGMDRLGPLAGKRSRGELVLRALRERDARGAADAIGALNSADYRGFTVIVADRGTAYAVASDEHAIRVDALVAGHHMVTPDGCDVTSSPRYRAHFPAFRTAPPPDPEHADWTAWETLLKHADEDDPHRAMTVITPNAFGTVCSAELALPRSSAEPPQLRFANGPPTRVPYEPIRAPWDRAIHVER